MLNVVCYHSVAWFANVGESLVFKLPDRLSGGDSASHLSYGMSHTWALNEH